MSSNSSPHVLVEENEIKGCQEKLASRLHATGKPREIRAEFQGGNVKLNARWFPKDRFWWGYQRLLDVPMPRHWNAFGYGESESVLDAPGSRSITCEINFPLSVGSWLITGALAKDKDGNIYIVHTGKIGGGRKAVGKSQFKEIFGGAWMNVAGNRGEKEVVKVSLLDDVNLVSNLGRFVRQMHEIRKIPT